MTSPTGTKIPAGNEPAGSPRTTGLDSGSSALTTSLGSTRIAETVVSKIAGLATREVSGVHALGGGAARVFGAVRERIPGATSNAGQGVTVEVGERQAAVDLDIVVEYGVAIAELAKAIRRNVIGALERMTGLEVVEVNVSVNDVYLPGDDSNTVERAPAEPPRVA